MTLRSPFYNFHIFSFSLRCISGFNNNLINTHLTIPIKIPKLAQLYPEYIIIFIIKLLGYFWGFTTGIQNYKQARNSGTQETPFALAFGTEVVDLVEVGLKSPRIELTNIEHNKEVLCLNLDLLEEKREQVLKPIEDYHRKTARYYDQRVKPRSYKPGDLVLKKLLPARKDPARGKLGPNWEGPYIVSHIIRPSNYELQTKEGKTLPHSWNAEHLKRFYQ